MRFGGMYPGNFLWAAVLEGASRTSERLGPTYQPPHIVDVAPSYFFLQVPFRNIDLRRAAEGRPLPSNRQTYFSSFAFLFSICRLIDPGWHSTQFVVRVLGGRPKAALRGLSTTRFVRTVCPNVLLVFKQADSSTMYHDKATTRRVSHVFCQGPRLAGLYF